VREEAARRFTRFDAAALAVLIAAVLLLYAQVVAHEPVLYDDPDYYSDNPRVAQGLTWDSVQWAFTTTLVNNWHPLTWLSLQLDFTLHGGQFWAVLLHSVLLHCANAALLYWVLVRLTGARWPALLAAALFALHPLRVESVAWASERKDTLSTLFWMLTMLAYVAYAQRGQAWRYVLAATALALGLMAKQMLVTLPFVLLLLDYWPLGRLDESRGWRTFARQGGRLVVEKLPLFVLALLFSVVVFQMQQGAGAELRLADLPLTLRLQNALTACVRYLAAFVAPVGLAPFYPYPVEGIAAWKWIGSLLLLAAATALVLLYRRRAPWALTGWLWFLGTLVPVIGIVQVGSQSMADRYTYVPGIGLSILTAWLVKTLAEKRPALARPLAAGCVCVLLVLSALTFRQIGFWSDTLTLFRHADAVTENNFVAQRNIGYVLFREGRHDEALQYFKRLLQYRGDDPRTHVDIGSIYMAQGRRREAVRSFQAAHRRDPQHLKANESLGAALVEMGRMEEARPYLERALERDEDNVRALLAMGAAHLMRGEFAEARRWFERAAMADPASLDARVNLAQCQIQMGEAEQALQQLQGVMRAQPNYVPGLIVSAYALDALGQSGEARGYMRRVLELQPGHPQAHAYLRGQ
jgi:tetratricopeptide (TPR) repeat protein